MLEHLKIMLGVYTCRHLVTTVQITSNSNNKNVEANSHFPQISVINYLDLFLFNLSLIFDFVGLFILISIKPHINTEAVWSSINLLLAHQRY